MRALRTIAAALAATALVGCAGVGSSTPSLGAAASSTPSVGAAASSTPSVGAAASPTTISFWTHTHPPMIEVYKQLIAKYEEANPNVKIDYQTIPNSDFFTKMLVSLTTASGPDVINMDYAFLQGEYIPKGLLAPIDPKAFGEASLADVEARYVAGTLAGATGADGTLYGLPSEFNGTAFAINTAHFADAGLDPNAPLKTWDDVVKAGKKLISAGHAQAFSFLYLHSDWTSAQFQILLQQTGGSIANGNNGALESPDSQKALQLWVDLAGGNKSIGNPNVTSREATAPLQDLATGVQSMGIMYPWAMEQIATTNPDTYKNLKVIPLPQVNPENPVSSVSGYYWAVNKASKVQAEAWKFVNFLSQNPEEFLTGTGFVQPVVGWEKSPAAQKMPFIDTWSQAYATGKFDEITARYSEVQDVIAKMVNDAVFNGVSVEQATKEASAAVSRILQNQ